MVETGFAALDDTASRPLAADTPLEPDTEYAFWFAVGTGRQETIETHPRALPSVPHGARLTVQIFGFEGELELIGTQRGVFELDGAGRSRVVERAALPHHVWDVERTLHFLVHTPDREGDARLRCNVYLGSTLLQSRLVTARVGGEPGGEVPALRSDLDYHLTDAMTAERLSGVPAHRISLMVNGIGGVASVPLLQRGGRRQPVRQRGIHRCRRRPGGDRRRARRPAGGGVERGR